jgi:hypothetical protein
VQWRTACGSQPRGEHHRKCHRQEGGSVKNPETTPTLVGERSLGVESWNAEGKLFPSDASDASDTKWGTLPPF